MIKEDTMHYKIKLLRLNSPPSAGAIFEYFLYFMLGFLLLSGLPGCGLATQTKGLKPLDPPVSGAIPSKVPVVSSLKPHLRWELESRLEKDLPGGQDGTRTFDLIIWKAIGVNTPGEVVYHKTGLTSSDHLVETPLAPGTVYFWAVKSVVTTKDGTYSTAWSSFDESDWGSLAFGPTRRARGLLWRFQTPG
jgi:hypothetical protein